MGARSRRKGSRGEREWAALLEARGWEARRVPLSGAAEGYPGDVESRLGDVTVLWQVKRRCSLPQWLASDIPVALRADRCEWWVLMPADDFLSLIARVGLYFVRSGQLCPSGRNAPSMGPMRSVRRATHAVDPHRDCSATPSQDTQDS